MHKRKRIGVGILGVGFIGPAHIDALKRLSGVRVRAIADINRQQAELVAQKYDIPKVYAHFEELIEDSSIDAVHVATPNYLHYSEVKSCIQAGKHVVCEKPLGINSKETGELVRLVHGKKLVNAVNFNNRYYPVVQLARRMIQGGELSSIYLVRGSILDDTFLYETDYNWRMELKEGGATQVVATLGCHWLDLAEFVTDSSVTAVFSDFHTFLPVRKKSIKEDQSKGKAYEQKKIQTEDYATILLQFANGARGISVLSQVSAGRKFEISLEIDGSISSLSWNSGNPNVLWRGFRNKHNELILKNPEMFPEDVRKFVDYPAGHTEGYPETFKKHFESVYRCIFEGKSLEGTEVEFPTFVDGHRIQLIIEAIVRSAKEKRWVPVKRTTKCCS